MPEEYHAAVNEKAGRVVIRPTWRPDKAMRIHYPGFRDYVDRHGDTAKAPEARYWLGKTLSARGANADAAGAYIAAIRGWPKTNWAPDAVLELSRSLIALKKPTDACATLAELAKRYPNAPAGVQSRAAQARGQAKCSG